MSTLWVLFKKELLDGLRDRRALVVMIVVPVFLYPVLMTLIGGMMVLGKERLARETLTVAVTSAQVRRLLGTPPARTTLVEMSRAEGEKALEAKQLWAIVDAPEGADAALRSNAQAVVTVLYTKRHDRSVEALSRLKKALEAQGRAVLVERLAQASLPPSFAQPLVIDEHDVDFQKDLGPLIASRLLPLILVMMLFMGALYPAIDATAGERERGTWETMLVAPVRPMQLMAAKYLMVTTLAIAAALANLIAMGVTLRAGLTVADGVSATMRLSAGQVGIMALFLVPTAFLVSGLSLALASLAKSFKEGQSLLTPLVLAGVAPGLISMMPGIELTAWTAAIPFLNIALLVKGTLLGAVQPLHGAIALASVLVCAVVAVWVASLSFRSERLRLNGLVGR